jgi:LCP family protein required for cell wall assembly
VIPRHASVEHTSVLRHAVAQPTHRVRHAVALGLAGVLAFTSAAGATTFLRLQGNVTVADVDGLVGADPKPSVTPTKAADPTDPQAGKAINILVLGSDERDGVNGEIGGTEGVAGMRSDTTMVVHLSADRSRAEVVSIPRDSLVDIPSCTMSDGKTTRAQHNAMFNSAFATGWDRGGDMASAAGCTIKTVQTLTGLTIDHFIVVDFAGFQSMIDAIGGVPICIAKDYSSEDAGLFVNAGYQTLDGPTALAYARARKGTNMNGSDLERATRQQELVAAIVRQVLSKNPFTNLGQLMHFLDAATSSLTVDPGLGSLTDLAGLALSAKNLSTSNITLLTIPVGTAPTDKNRVVWTKAATEVWNRMLADEPISGTPAPADPGTSAPAGSAPASTAPGSGASTPAGGATPAPGSSAPPASAPAPQAPLDPIQGVTSFNGDTQDAATCG